MIKKLKNKMYQYIEEYGLNSKLTINASQNLDKELNRLYRKNAGMMYFYEQSITGLSDYYNKFKHIPSKTEWDFFALDNDYLCSESIKHISGMSFKNWCLKILKKYHK